MRYKSFKLHSNRRFRKVKPGLSCYAIKTGEARLIFKQDKDAITVCAGDTIIVQQGDVLDVSDTIVLFKLFDRPDLTA
jgi:hypothetical protein